jgi:hypothetical protein
MGDDLRKKYKERAAYLEKVRHHRAIVGGRQDYDFTQHLAPSLRGTYEGQALLDKWHRECFVPDFLAALEYEVDDLAELAAWEKDDNERFRKRNRLPPSLETRRAAIEAKRAAAIDEPPSLLSTNDADDAEETTSASTAPTEREEITLFGCVRKVK